MKTTISFHEFAEGFRSSSYYNNFTREALSVMFDWYEALEDDTGVEIEYDVCAISEDWDECTFDELLERCGLDAGSIDIDDIDVPEIFGFRLSGDTFLVYVPDEEDLADYLTSIA